MSILKRRFPVDQEQEMRKAFEFAWLRALGAPDLALRNVLDGKRIMDSAWKDFMSTRVESEPLRTGGEQGGMDYRDADDKHQVMPPRSGHQPGEDNLKDPKGIKSGVPEMEHKVCMGPTEQDVKESQIGHPVVFPERSKFVLQHKDASHLPDNDPIKTGDWATVEIKREGPVLTENEEGLPTMVIKVVLACDLHVPMDCIEAGTGEILAQLAGERMVIDLEEDYMPVLADKVQTVLDDWDAKAVAALAASTRVDDTEPGFDEKDPRATI